MIKPGLLLETGDETNGLCLQWISCISGTTAQDVPMLARNLSLGKQEVGLIVYSFRNMTGGREPVVPLDT